MFNYLTQFEFYLTVVSATANEPEFPAKVIGHFSSEIEFTDIYIKSANLTTKDLIYAVKS